MHINENIVNKLTDELAFAKEAGYELTLEEISKVSGGSFPCHHCQYDACPKKEVESPSW